MRDYVDYFMDRKPLEKRGVSIHRDIDWWMEQITGHMAKLLFIVLLAALALSLKSFVQVGKSRLFFPIEQIAINGDILITTPQDINEVLSDVTGSSFFAVDLNDVSTELTNLPWIESAVVTRRWPNTLSVELVERKANYRWGEAELLDNLGNRFANTNNEVFDELPKLAGIKGHEADVIYAYRQLMGHLGISAERLDINQFVLNQYLSWELHLQSGVVIKFGRDDYAKRIARFAEAFQAGKLPELDKLDVLDFRYNRGFAAKWKPEFSPEMQDGKLVKVAKESTTGI